MDPVFQLAIAPRRHTCLRLRLEPLALGHWFLLARYAPFFIDSEFSQGGASLPLAVLICSQSPADAAKAVRKWWVPLFCLFWGWLCRKSDFEAETQAFADYMKDGMSVPSVALDINATPRETNAPLGFWLLSVLLSEFAMSETEAMSLPIARALCLRAAHAEAAGQCRLVGRRTRALWERMEAERRPDNVVAMS